MQTHSPSVLPASRRVQVLNRPVDLSTIGDLDVVSVLPSVPNWRDRFGTAGPHLFADEPPAKIANYAKAIDDLAKFVIGKLRPGIALTLTIASPLPSDGRSTVVANMAVVCAEEHKKKVLLIDADLHRHALGTLFSPAGRPLGISNVLKGAVYWRDLVISHPSSNLDFLCAGTASIGNDLPSAELALMLQEAKPFYDLILLDSAPLLRHPQTIDLAIATDATLLLARRNHTRQSELVSALGYLRRIEARVLAIVLNDA